MDPDPGKWLVGTFLSRSVSGYCSNAGPGSADVKWSPVQLGLT